jgi:hypothetical protein
MRDKIAGVASAQKSGAVPARLGAAELVLAVQALARMWFTSPEEVVSAVDDTASQERRRKAVWEAVTALLSESADAR